MSDTPELPPEDDDRTIIRSPAANATTATAVAHSFGDVATPTATTTTPPSDQRAASPTTATALRDNTLAVGTYVAEFEITDILGEGGFGIVYLAWDHSLERKIALKEYMPSSLAARGEGLSVSVKSARHQDTFEAGLRSFVNEAKLLAQFDHPSVVKVYRFWEANGTAYMVMPFYEGITVKDALKAMSSPPSEAWLTNILAPLTEALAMLHQHQCYHRDIAPDNIILLKDSGRPLLLDFGAARRVIGDMTQALTVILKSGYAPLEQYAEVPGLKQGPWTDVYAMAATIYFAITGKTPPPAVGRLVNDSYIPLAQSAPSSYSASFLQAIDHALAVKPEQRTASMADFMQALGIVPGSVTHTLIAPTHTPASPRTSHARKSKTALLAASALGGLLLLGGAGYALWGGDATPTPATAPSAEVAAPAVNASEPTTADAAPSVAPVQPTPTDAATKAPFDPVRELHRIVENASAGHHVQATASKPRFKIGSDRLKFSFTSAQDGYAYVLLMSTDGHFLKLYPNKMSKPNKVRAGQHITLPDASWPLDVAGPAGIDHFVVIVSENPRDFSHLGAVSEDGMTVFPPEQAKQAYEQHTSQGSAFTGNAVCSNGITPCSDNYGAAYFSLEEYE